MKKTIRGIPANRQRQKTNRVRWEIGKKWFNGKKLYRKGQPFRTLMEKMGYNEIQLVHNKIKALVPEPKKRTALEIGPGVMPVLQEFPFKERVFMDISLKLARNLKQTIGGQVLVGDIRKIPLTAGKENFGVVVVNEVLTHILPSERTKAIAEIARISDSLLIIDRKQISINKLINIERINAREKLNLLTGTKTKRARATRKKIREKLSIKITGSALRMEQARLINFKLIETVLRKQGWQIQKQDIERGGVTYTIFSAKRKQ